MSQPILAYLAEGKFFVVQSDGSSRQIESQFVQDLNDRADRDRQRHGWKRQSSGWNTRAAAMGAAGFLSTLDDDGSALTRSVRFTSLAPIDANRWSYALRIDAMGGLFEYDLSQKSERRLVHKQGMCIAHVSPPNHRGEHALSLLGMSGTAHLATCEMEGRRLREITEGDCVDECPAWAAPDSRTIVYQSAGIGRNSQGGFVGLSPYSIQTLDLVSGNHEILWEDESHDYLTPRLLPDGTLYCIRRPYEPVKKESAFILVRDAIAFPYRLARAVLGFLNVFSMIFTKKPLITSGAPGSERNQGPDARWIFLHRRLVKVKNAGSDASPDLVPSNWQLVRRSPSGEVSVIANSILSFDLSPDGTVYYTNGSVITQHSPSGVKTQVAKGKYIEILKLPAQS